MPVARPESSDARIIAHVDMDCFYVQVEQRKQPYLRGQPTAVVQYNSWKGGALIAVSYEARKCGVKRSMRGDEAKKVCPQIHLVQVPVTRGKADLNIYRSAGSEVVSILSKKGRCERASIDEVYLDLTDAAESMLCDNPPESLESIDEEALKSHLLGLNKDGIDSESGVRQWLISRDADHRDKLLACGTLIVAELRMQVLKETGFTCSAGIAHNKMLAKLASAMNKPAQQTVVPLSSVKELLGSLPIKKMKQLGGKLGSSIESDLGVNTIGDLLQFSEDKLQERYGVNTGTWLWNIARGISGEEVESRLLPKSHGSGKTFRGPQALKTITSVEHWLNQLCEDLSERICSDLDQNKRIAQTLTLHVSAYKSADSDSYKKFPSKSCPLRYGASKIQYDALILFQAGLREYLGSFLVNTEGSQNKGWAVTSLAVSASKIVAIPSGTCSIAKFFHTQDASCSSAKQSHEQIMQDSVPLLPLRSESHSVVVPTESQTGLPETENNITMASLNQPEENFKPWEDQENDPMQYSCKHDSLIQESHNVLPQNKSPPLPSGSRTCSEINQTELKREPSRTEEAKIGHSVSNLERQQQKRKTSKDMGTSSILRFFKGKNISSSQMLEHGDTRMLPSSPPDLGQDSQRREAWNYRNDEIDPSVIDELPPEIQEEIRAWLRPLKQPSVPKHGSSIDHYFSPTKNT